jgi:hypothetical protein
MRIVRAETADDARREYVQQLEQSNVVLGSGVYVYVEKVHRPEGSNRAWLCYVSTARPEAA